MGSLMPPTPIIIASDFLWFLMHLSLGPGGRRQGLIQSNMGKGAALAVPNSSLNKIFR